MLIAFLKFVKAKDSNETDELAIIEALRIYSLFFFFFFHDRLIIENKDAKWVRPPKPSTINGPRLSPIC